MFLSRHRRGSDRFVWIKLACLAVGGGLGVVGMRWDSAVLIDVAIAIVLAGFALRFVRQPATQALLEDRLSDAESPPP